MGIRQSRGNGSDAGNERDNKLARSNIGIVETNGLYTTLYNVRPRTIDGVDFTNAGHIWDKLFLIGRRWLLIRFFCLRDRLHGAIFWYIVHTMLLYIAFHCPEMHKVKWAQETCCSYTLTVTSINQLLWEAIDGRLTNGARWQKWRIWWQQGGDQIWSKWSSYRVGPVLMSGTWLILESNSPHNNE